MCGGGGGSGSAGPDYAAEERRAEADRAERQSNAARARQDAERAATAAQEEWGAARNRGASFAVNRIQSELRNRGADVTQYGDWMNDLVNSRWETLGRNEDPNTVFNDDFVNNAINDRNRTERMQRQRQVSSAFRDGYDVDAFTDTADDSYIDNIIGQQRTNAMSTIERARARGQLNDTGFNNAVQRLDTQASAGRATANSLGQSVIDSYRKQLREIGDTASSRAGEFNIGDEFNLDTFTNQLNNRKTDLTNNFGGAVNAALSGQEFFDIGDIINSGGQAQGIANPTPATLDAQAERDRVRNAQRGVGGSGTF